MANVLRGLGYRVHPPSEEHGPLYAFSVKPRFVREREEQRERQRQQQRQQRDQQRRQRPERPNERQFFADSPRPERNKDERRRDGPPNNPPNKERRDDRPPGARSAERIGRARIAAGRGRRAATAAGRRCASTPPPRRRATPADSPFAKLLELKLGGKK